MPKELCIYCDSLVDLDEDLDAYLDDEVVCQVCREMLDGLGELKNDSDTSKPTGEDTL
jgi:hypothetical protein